MSGQLRVTGGALVRRKFRVPPAADRGAVRPTSDRVREALFSVLTDVGDAVVLDVFAGSGALGIEALSRGAATCTFIERDRATAAVLRENLQTLSLVKQARVVDKEASRALAAVKAESVDLVFADPPYALDLDTEWMARLAGSLRANGRLVIERDKRSEIVPTPPGTTLTFDRAWGQTRVFVFTADPIAPSAVET